LAYVFSYLYLWTVSPQVWPEPASLAPAVWPVVSAALLVASAVAAVLSARVLPARHASRLPFTAVVTLGIAALVAALGLETWTHRSVGLDPAANAHDAMVAMALFLQAQLAAPAAIWGVFAMARLSAGHLDTRRCATVENLKLFWLYTAAQGLVALLLVHGFPRVLA
jgi:cytochrome c oxidase subunit I+III